MDCTAHVHGKRGSQQHCSKECLPNSGDEDSGQCLDAVEDLIFGPSAAEENSMTPLAQSMDLPPRPSFCPSLEQAEMLPGSQKSMQICNNPFFDETGRGVIHGLKCRSSWCQ